MTPLKQRISKNTPPLHSTSCKNRRKKQNPRESKSTPYPNLQPLIHPSWTKRREGKEGKTNQKKEKRHQQEGPAWPNKCVRGIMSGIITPRRRRVSTNLSINIKEVRCSRARGYRTWPECTGIDLASRNAC